LRRAKEVKTERGGKRRVKTILIQSHGKRDAKALLNNEEGKKKKTHRGKEESAARILPKENQGGRQTPAPEKSIRKKKEKK